jgi:hypothetical protein
MIIVKQKKKVLIEYAAIHSSKYGLMIKCNIKPELIEISTINPL